MNVFLIKWPHISSVDKSSSLLFPQGLLAGSSDLQEHCCGCLVVTLVQSFVLDASLYILLRSDVFQRIFSLIWTMKSKSCNSNKGISGLDIVVAKEV